MRLSLYIKLNMQEPRLNQASNHLIPNQGKESRLQDRDTSHQMPQHKEDKQSDKHIAQNDKSIDDEYQNEFDAVDNPQIVMTSSKQNIKDIQQRSDKQQNNKVDEKNINQNANDDKSEKDKVDEHNQKYQPNDGDKHNIEGEYNSGEFHKMENSHDQHSIDHNQDQDKLISVQSQEIQQEEKPELSDHSIVESHQQSRVKSFQKRTSSQKGSNSSSNREDQYERGINKIENNFEVSDTHQIQSQKNSTNNQPNIYKLSARENLQQIEHFQASNLSNKKRKTPLLPITHHGESEHNFWYEQLNIPEHQDYQTYQGLKQMINLEDLEDQVVVNERQSDHQLKRAIIKPVDKIKEPKLSRQKKINEQKKPSVKDLWSSLRNQISKQEIKLGIPQQQKSYKSISNKELKQTPKINRQIPLKEIQKSQKIIENELLNHGKINQQIKKSKGGSDSKQLKDKVKQWSKINRQLSFKRKVFSEQQQYQIWAEENAKKQEKKIKMEEEKRERAKAAQQRLQRVELIKQKQQENSRVKSRIREKQDLMKYLYEDKYVSKSKTEKKEYKKQKKSDRTLSLKQIKRPRKAVSSPHLKLKINQEPNLRNEIKSSEITSKHYQLKESSLGGYQNFIQYKKSIQVFSSDKQKLRRRRIFNNRVREIPINMSSQKKKQLLIGIDKGMSPLKYQLLSRRGLTDLEIYQSSKQFEISASKQRKIGKDYLQQLRIKNQGNQMKLYRSIESSPLKESHKIQSQKKLLAYESDLHNYQARLRREKDSLAGIVTNRNKSQIKKEASEDEKYLKALGF